MKTLLIAVMGAVTAAACGGSDASVSSMSAAADSNVTAAPSKQRLSPSVQTSYTFTSAPAARAEQPNVARPATVEEAPNSAGARESVRGVPEYREVTLPAGTVLALRLTSTVASDSNAIEDSVGAALREDIMLDGSLVVPAGAEVTGRIVEVERSGRVKGRARVAFRFTMLKHDGDEYDVRTEAIERVADATKGDDATKIAIGGGAGAALGAILGGGSGAAKGATIGAAAGTGAVLATRGEEVRLEPGEVVDTRLTAAVPVRVRRN